MRVVLDIEADGLTPTKIWVVVLKDIDTNEVHHFLDKDSLNSFLMDSNLSLVVSHNGIEYDWYWLKRLWGIDIPRSVCRDTLVLSRLYDQRLQGGHSLEAWGERLKFPKLEFNDFHEYSEKMLEYCIQDVELNHKLYVHLNDKFRYPRWEQSIKLEHDMAFLCVEMRDNGFCFNIERAKELLSEIQTTLKELDTSILKEFKPIKKLEKSFDLKKKKDGTWSKKTADLFLDPMVELEDGKLNRYVYQEFNPQSSRQVCERLVGLWDPYDKTDGHKAAIKDKDKEKLEHYKIYGWKVSEANLSTLKDDAPDSAKLLVKRIMLGARERILLGWIESYNPTTGRIHGTFNSLGTWTHRLSHTDPNLGNVSAEKTIKYKGEELRKLAIYYGGEFRKLFIAPKGSKLIGVDMEGAHLRLFAHFIDDKELIQALVSGDKKKGTDPHTVNKNKLGDLCPDRDLAKTFIFTYLNGGGVPKVMEIFQCSKEKATEALDNFIESYPGLKKLKTDKIPTEAKQGWFRGLDGRKVPCDSEHFMVAGYLQNGEAVVMKLAAVRCDKHFKENNIPAKLVNFVHDELQWETPDDKDIIEYVGKYTSDMITQIGLDLKIVCPLAGEWKQGDNWLDSH